MHCTCGRLGYAVAGNIAGQSKCLAPVNGRPFITHLVDYLLKQGIEKLIVSLGYQHELVIKYLQQQYAHLSIDYVIESEPLGTGGAITKSMQAAVSQHVFVVNGDTLCSHTCFQHCYITFATGAALYAIRYVYGGLPEDMVRYA